MNTVNKKLGISVIIPTYNRLETISRTLSVIGQSNIYPDEILIIDQSNKFNIAREIEGLCNSSSLNIRYVHRESPSLVAARNHGLRIAKFDIIVYMDDDVDVKTDTFLNVKEIFQNEKIAMAGGMNSFAPKSMSFLGYMTGKKYWHKRKIGHVTKAAYGRFPLSVGDNIRTEWCMGFFFVIRKSLAEEWNMFFDEHLCGYSYPEDLDFTYGYYRNAKIRNLECIMSSKLEVLHRVSTEYRTPSKEIIYTEIVHREYVRFKYFNNSIASICLFMWSNFSDIIFRLIKGEDWKQYISANIYMFQHIDEIRKGIFHYEDFK